MADKTHAYKPYLFLLGEPQSEMIETIDERSKLIGKYRRCANEVMAQCPSQLSLHLVQLELGQVNADLAAKARDLVKRILESMTDETANDIKGISIEARSDLINPLSKSLKSAKDVVDMEGFFQFVLATGIPELTQKVERVKVKVSFLFAYEALSSELLERYHSTYSILEEITDALKIATNIAESERTKLQESARRERLKLETDLQLLLEKALTLREVKSTRNYRDYVDQTCTMLDDAAATRKRAEDIMAEEDMLGVHSGEFTKIQDIEGLCLVLNRFWSLIVEYHAEETKWFRSPLNQLDAKQLDADHQRFIVSFQVNRPPPFQSGGREFICSLKIYRTWSFAFRRRMPLNQLRTLGRFS